MYEIIFTRRAAKFVKNLPKSHREKLKYVIESMKINPFSQPYCKIRGEPNLYRIRLGKFRVLYEIDDKLMKVVIFKIDKRSKAYDR